MRTMLLGLGLLAGFAGMAAAAPTPRTTTAADRPTPVWVFFADKDLAPATEHAAVDEARAALTPRAIERRLKTRAPGEEVDLLDVPVSERYVTQLEAAGARVRARSRWLNAVSIEAGPAALDRVRALPFVARVQRVAAAAREPEIVEPTPTAAPEAAPPGPTTRALNYGQCTSQIVPIQVNQLHDAGLSGAGVFVCMLDTGFLRTHQALDQVNVIAERDFIHGDNVTSNQPGDDPNQHNHGTYCLSILGGFDPGNLIGPAYGASFLLGKTEEITSETPVEEDFWIAGAEWADSLGADVISSSLTYSDWYVYDDMDGDTAPITIAADLATLNGIVVCNAAGNLGDDPWFYIAAPADGDSVIAVGAVDSLGVITGFSSRGPTSDGRTKPDVCAMGSGNIFASMFSPSSYSRGSGTSFSCPLVAGVAALLLQAHPGWTPMHVRDALRLTATNAASPNNEYGWGIIRGWNAHQWGGTAAPEIEPASGVSGFFASPNPSRGLTILRADLAPGETIAAIAIHDARGRLVRNLEGSTWDGRNDDGTSAPAGIYFARMVTNRTAATARIVRLR